MVPVGGALLVATDTGARNLRMATITLSESHEGYSAAIRGPEGKMAKQHMRTVLTRLLKQL